MQTDTRQGKKQQKKIRKRITDPGYLREADLAQYASVCVRQVRYWMASGVIPFLRVSKRLVLFKKSDVDAALEKFRVC